MKLNDTTKGTVYVESQMILNAVHSLIPDADSPDSQDEEDDDDEYQDTVVMNNKTSNASADVTSLRSQTCKDNQESRDHIHHMPCMLSINPCSDLDTCYEPNYDQHAQIANITKQLFSQLTAVKTFPMIQAFIDSLQSVLQFLIKDR